MTDVATLVAAVRETLHPLGDPTRAVEQQRYMKSAMPYLGIAAPALKAALRGPLAELRLLDPQSWAHGVRTLWDEATHREEWYAALALARHRHYRGWRLEAETLALWEHLVRTGRWWDVCDETAQHLVSPLVARHPELGQVIRGWAHDDELWIRRVAVQSQLGQGAEVDQHLLADTIEPNLADQTFWLRKAIGWALREHSKVDPDWVRAFVAAHESQLSGLSRREALRLID